MAHWTIIEHPPSPPDRPADGHKGTFGTVIIVGGCPTMIGAPAICARAAFRTGAGLVKLAVDPAILPHTLAIEPGATGIELAGDASDQLAALDAADPDGEAVLAVGPGMGQAEAAGDLVDALLAGRRPIVLDADGLNLLAAAGGRLDRAAPTVLTPHPGEYRRLASPLKITASPVDPSQRIAAAVTLARAHRATVVLKGRHSVITDGQRVFVNESGNAALATAGAGDVLTGVIASLLAQGMAPFDAAALGAHLHGRAADLWTQAHGPTGLLARDLADLIPRALSDHAIT